MSAEPGPLLRTERLLLRRWRADDRPAFAALNADPEVTRFLPGPISREQSDALADRIEAHFAARGFGLFAVEWPGQVAFAGFVGLSVPGFEPPFTSRVAPRFAPCVEVGWRLARASQGRGIATEAAREVLRFGFEELGLEEIVSFTVPANRPSRRVMERIGMRHDPAGDFDHPRLSPGDPLRAHVLYRLSRDDWRAGPRS